MFNDKLLAIMFSNIEKIYFFHRDFLRSVERQYIEGSEEVGAVFMENVSFSRTQYCMYIAILYILSIQENEFQ